jgi:hypothetical protein
LENIIYKKILFISLTINLQSSNSILEKSVLFINSCNLSFILSGNFGTCSKINFLSFLLKLFSKIFQKYISIVKEFQFKSILVSVFQKIFRITSQSFHHSNSGKVVNLILLFKFFFFNKSTFSFHSLSLSKIHIYFEFGEVADIERRRFFKDSALFDCPWLVSINLYLSSQFFKYLSNIIFKYFTSVVHSVSKHILSSLFASIIILLSLFILFLYSIYFNSKSLLSCNIQSSSFNKSSFSSRKLFLKDSYLNNQSLFLITFLILVLNILLSLWTLYKDKFSDSRDKKLKECVVIKICAELEKVSKNLLAKSCAFLYS